MSERGYVEQLRSIRDQIGRELERTSWEQWEKLAREEAQRYPKLARLLDEAVQVPPAAKPVKP